jgi:hypothetical protein
MITTPVRPVPKQLSERQAFHRSAEALKQYLATLDFPIIALPPAA